MKKIIGSVLFLLLFPLLVFPQEEKQNPFRLKITGTISAYTDECKINGQNQLVDLEKTIPSIQLDIRYATHDNFTHRQVYKSAKAYLRKPAAAALSAVQQDLAEKGLGLKVYDAYRPYSATILFYDLVRDTLFVASPAKGSRHNRGCAVDVSLIDLKTGVELAMPTAFDDFSARAGAFYADLPVIAKENRKTLIEAMKKQGFDVFDSEWWHFDFQGWQAFSLMDISFEELEQP
jgi:D-alanyl-D-alanine dipeptidase